MTDSDMEIVSRYIDGELSVDERESFEARLVAEPALQAALQQAQKLDARLKKSALKDGQLIDRWLYSYVRDSVGDASRRSAEATTL